MKLPCALGAVEAAFKAAGMGRTKRGGIGGIVLLDRMIDVCRLEFL